MARVPYATKADSPVTAWLRNYWLLLSRCITAIGTRHFGWSRPICPNWTSRPSPNIRPTSKQGASTGKEPGQTR